MLQKSNTNDHFFLASQSRYAYVVCIFFHPMMQNLLLGRKRQLVQYSLYPFFPPMHYAENECAMPIRLYCNELRALCLTTNALCRTAEFGALLPKCVLIVYIWTEKGVHLFDDRWHVKFIDSFSICIRMPVGCYEGC